MPFRDPETCLQNILESAETIAEFLIGIDLTTYKTDRKTRSAVERQLQILTEAAFRLGEDAEKLCPTVDWRGVRGLGNVLRHEYDDIEDEVIWRAIQDRLPPLKAAVRKALAKLQNPRPKELA